MSLIPRSGLPSPAHLCLVHRKCQNVNVQIVRTSKISKRRKEHVRIHAPHIPMQAPERTPSVIAKAFFDDHYGKVFGPRWPSIRLALHTNRKHCALVNNMAMPEEARDLLRNLGCFSVKDAVKDAMDKVADRAEKSPSLHTVPNFERHGNRRSYLEKLDDEAFQDPKAKVEDVSMRADEETIRGRIIDPGDQVLEGKNNADILHDFVPTSSIKGMEDFVEESKYYQTYTKLMGDVPFQKIPDPGIRFPDTLDAFIFPSSDISRFPQPTASVVGTYNFFCMDLSSLLPVLALNLKPQDSVLDMCAGPGGKSLAMMQTLKPSSIVCNDVSRARLQRVGYVMNMYLGEFQDIRKLVSLNRGDGVEFGALNPGTFDKVLCDVPCFNDRNVMHKNENNIFSTKRNRERIQLPELQRNLLYAAMLCVKPGGSVVYSTCTLSPMQNDGVVCGALLKAWEQSDMNFYISDLSDAFDPLKSILNLVNKEVDMKYGQLVLPSITNNFGPMYIAKLTRTQ